MYEDDNYNRWCFRRVLAQKYDVVVTNPPYMAVSNAGPKVQEYIKENYPDSKSDLFACFIERCGKLIGKGGYQGMITQHAWMFLSSYERLRAKLRLTDTVNMVHLGARAFEEIGGEVVQTTSFVMRQSHIAGYKGTYCRLIEPTTQQGNFIRRKPLPSPAGQLCENPGGAGGLLGEWEDCSRFSEGKNR